QARFSHLQRFLESTHTFELTPIFTSGSETPYDDAKRRLIKIYSLTFPQRMKRALTEESLGADERVAEFRARVAPLLEGLNADFMMKYLLYTQLPTDSQSHVSGLFDLPVGDFQE
ncbi:Hypothetical predicted protein, partial [Paramuricea clavata]